MPDIRAAVEAIAAPESDEPESNFRRLETTRLIQVALDQLPTHYGNALEWKYVYGFSVEEIAAKLGVGVEAAQSLLARAKRGFQEVYGALTSDLVSERSEGRPKPAVSRYEQRTRPGCRRGARNWRSLFAHGEAAPAAAAPRTPRRFGAPSMPNGMP